MSSVLRYPLLAFTLGVAACASSQVQEDPSWPQACVVIDNRQSGGAAGRVILVTPLKERIRVGEVPMGEQKRHCFRRPNIAGEYQLLIEDPGNDRMDPAQGTPGSFSGNGRFENQPPQRRSPVFNLNVGTVMAWNVHLNQLRLLETGG